MGILWYISTAVMVFLTIFKRHSVESLTVKHSEATTSNPKVLVLSIAGLWEDYLTNDNFTNIKQIISNGTKAKFVENSANVLDIVTHYSIATGLHPESNSIISNIMYDPDLKRVFDSKTREESEWWVNVHPIWQEIETQGKGLSAVCHWPGVYGPMKSTLHCEAEKIESLKADVDKAVQWFNDGVKLVLLHSDGIKKAALTWGPHSPQAMDQVKRLDTMLKYLSDKTKDLNVNVLLTSDSGVTDLKWNHIIDLDQCITPDSYLITQPQATLLIYPKQGYTVQELYQNLTQCPHVRVYLKQELPAQFHFSNNRRIPPLVAFVPLGAVVRSGKPLHQRINEQLAGGNESELGKNMGGSGYHPGYDVMRGVFIGYGPSFKQGMKFRAIKNVDIYGVVCYLLGVNPRPNNGSRDVVTAMFNDVTSADVITGDVNTTSSPEIIFKRPSDIDVRVLFWFLVVVTALIVIFCSVGCFATMYSNYKRGYQCRTKIHEYGDKKLLSDDSCSSDEE